MFGRKKEKEDVCPYCHKHCTEDHIRCDRGREYFRKPLGKKNPNSSSSVSSSESHHHHHHHHQSSSSSSTIPNYSLYDLDTLEMTPNQRTYALFCKCRYIFRYLERYGSVDVNSAFSCLTDEEQDTLNMLLRKFAGAHALQEEAEAEKREEEDLREEEDEEEEES